MKRTKLFFVLATIVALCVGFSSCGRNSLVGTTWVADDNDGGIVAFAFTTEVSGTYTQFFDEEPQLTVAFTYTFNAPVITITFTGRVNDADASDIQIDSHLLTGEVRGSRMIFRVEGEEGEFILVRQ